MTKFADDLYDDLMRAHGPALAATRARLRREVNHHTRGDSND